MFNRPVLFAGVLVAAVAVPYLWFDKQWAAAARGQYQTWLAQAQRATGGGAPAAKPANSAIPAAPAVAAAPRPVAPTLESALRFDVTPAWVTSHWPQVSTVAGDAEHLGMRVTLVSGTRPDDVAGSLTYYFDRHHVLERITFTGLTGDARRVLATAVTPNGLESQPTTHAARYTAGDPAKPTSEVVVRHLPVIRAEASRARYEVAIDLRRSDVVGWGEKAARRPEPTLLPASYRPW